MITKEKFDKIQPKMVKALTEAIYKAALKYPQGFKKWLCGLSEGPSERP